jgi:hypothetical protein
MQSTKERIIHKEVVCSLADDMSVMEEMTSKFKTEVYAKINIANFGQ